jgi:hypothetical protein
MWNFFGVRMASDVPPAPTAVSLTQFSAKSIGDLGVQVTWHTAEELNNFGYNLYRGASTDFSEATVVHFEPTAVSGGTGPGTDYVYQENVPAYGTYYYWLEDVDTEGQKQKHGPVMTQISRIKTIYLPLIIK